MNKKPNVFTTAVLLVFAAHLYAAKGHWETDLKRANRLERDGRYEQAEKVYRVALRQADQSGRSDGELAQALNNHGATLYHLGKYQLAERALLRALGGWEKDAPEPKISQAVTLNNLAALYRAQGNYQEAEAYHERSLLSGYQFSDRI